jgi:hypothetical protein
MDSAAALDEARASVARGNTRGAIVSLRTRAQNQPESMEARLALATLYRELGHADQAGRWGSLEPGWAKPEEIKAFARLAVSLNAGEGRLRSLMHLQPGMEVPEAVREEMARVPVAAPGPDDERSWIAAMFTGLATFVVAVIGHVVVFWMAGAGAADSRAVSRWTTLIVVALLSVTAALFAITGLDKKVRGYLWFAPVAVILGAATVALASNLES